MSLRWESVLAWRLGRQGLAERAPAAAWREVCRICGLHAQVMSSAELTLWARVDDLPRDAVQDALWERRTLVKTWAMRGTLHLLPAGELPTYVAALSRLRPRHHVPGWLRHHGLRREGADAMLAAIPAALDGEPLTRGELAAASCGAASATCSGPPPSPATSASRPATGSGCAWPARTAGSERGSRTIPRRRRRRSCGATWRPTGRRRASSSSAGSG